MSKFKAWGWGLGFRFCGSVFGVWVLAFVGLGFGVLV